MLQVAKSSMVGYSPNNNISPLFSASYLQVGLCNYQDNNRPTARTEAPHSCKLLSVLGHRLENLMKVWCLISMQHLSAFEYVISDSHQGSSRRSAHAYLWYADGLTNTSHWGC
jgi:hypothetical protein